MASETTSSFDDLERVSNDFDDDDAKQIQRLPGGNVVDSLRQIHTGLGCYNSTLIHIASGIGDEVKL